MAELKLYNRSSKYRFNSKVLDAETGLYYYVNELCKANICITAKDNRLTSPQHSEDCIIGYYTPRISLWYGVDPMAEKYPDWNPFRYCFNNPIRIIDLTGMNEEDGDQDTPVGPHKLSKEMSSKLNNFLSKLSSSDQSNIEPNELNSPYSKGSQTRWLDTAEVELGTSEIEGDKHNSKIISYHASTDLKSKSDETPWCSSFVNFCINSANIKGTNSAAALSWNSWEQGESTKDPALGSIAVINYGEGKGHVGFVAGKTQTGNLVLLGGNQGNMVKYSAFSNKMTFILPKGYSKDFSLPILNVGIINNFKQTR